MKNFNYKKLQNGSDIRGVAMDGILGEAPNLTPVEARRLGQAFALWLSKKLGLTTNQLTIAVGHDPRLSAEALKSGLFQGFYNLGVKVLDCGLASTPAMFMSTVFPDYKTNGAVMITASHLPFNRNGFKFFDTEGGLNKSDISDIIKFAEAIGDSEYPVSKPNSTYLDSNTANPASVKDTTILKNDRVYPNVIKTPLMDTYCDFLKAKIRNDVNHAEHYEQPLAGLKITVDAGNGGGGFYALKVLAPLGADVSSSQFLEPDGNFPNHAPNPEDRAAMAHICGAVLRAESDFGLIFDTDVDRSSAVDKNGKEISRNGIVAMAAALIADSHPGTTVVTDSITSDELSTFLTENLGLKHLRFKRGYKNVINESIRLNSEGIDSQLAIETSGHAALKENYFLDDGAYLATKIVIKAALLAKEGRTLDELISGLCEALESLEVRFPILAEDFAACGDKIIDGLRDFANGKIGINIAEPNFEGVRISFDKNCGNGWCLLRKSLHDPIMPLNIESNSQGGLLQISNFLKDYLSNIPDLDISSLK